MEADGPEGIAEIILTPCIFRKEEKARIVAAVMTVGNHPALEPYHKSSLYIYYLDTHLKDKSLPLSVKFKIFTCRSAQGEICFKN